MNGKDTWLWIPGRTKRIKARNRMLRVLKADGGESVVDVLRARSRERNDELIQETKRALKEKEDEARFIGVSVERVEEIKESNRAMIARWGTHDPTARVIDRERKQREGEDTERAYREDNWREKYGRF